MSKWTLVVLVVLLVLAGAMGLRNVVTAHGDGPVVMANGGDPLPISPFANGGDPLPISPFANGGDPLPISPF